MNPRTLHQIETSLAHAREELLRESQAAEADLATLTEIRVEPELIDRAQDEALISVLDRLDERERGEIAAIDAALARIRAGTFGTCLGCGEAIAVARLQAQPTATLCQECAGAARKTPPARASRPARGAHHPARERRGAGR
ncbi:MAG: TraR/DksA C4-type zinc finger protein [bacterium]